MFAIHTVGIRTQVSFPLDFSLHEHLFKTADLRLLVSDLSRKVMGKHLVELLFFRFATGLQLVIFLLHVAAKGFQSSNLGLSKVKLVL